MALAWFIWRRSDLSNYRIARRLDRGWNTQDQLATALHFSDDEAQPVAAQRALAVSAISGRDAREAVPVETPSSVWMATAATGLAAALLVVRLTVAPGLSLSAPMPGLPTPSQGGATAASAEEDAQEELAAGDRSRVAAEAEMAEARDRSDAELPPTAAMVPDEGEEAAATMNPDAQPGDPLSFDQPSEQPSDSGMAAEEGETLDGQEPSSEQAESGSNWSEESNSLLDRLKDALDRMRENAGAEPGDMSQQNAESQEGAGEDAAPESGEPSDAESGADGASAEASMESDGAETQDAEQASQGNGGTQGPGDEQGGDAAGAAGDGEGEKQIEQQLAQDAAFDNLEEFYLQRAEELSGEVLVETTSGEAVSLSTPYRAQQAGRSDDSGLAARDDAPAAYQAFLENYFRRIRSQEQ